VVTGHAAGLVEEELDRIRERSPLEIRTLHNADWMEGSVLSFFVSLPELETSRQPVLLMDGDVLYQTEIVRRLIVSDHPTALLIDRSYSTADDDPVLVPIVGGRPVDFRKRWSGSADVVGESVGFFKVAPSDLAAIAKRTRARVEAGTRGDSYDDVLRDLVVEGRFDHEDITGLAWTEIDFPTDVERARREILPRVRMTRSGEFVP
jgi:choline kinase